MLNKEDFISAMKFFDQFENLRDSITASFEKFFDGNGFLFVGLDPLYNKYLDLLKLAMNIDLDDEYDPISYYLYESNYNVYSEPDKNGICTIIGKKDYKFCTIRVGDRTFEIKNPEDLYEYIQYINNS